MLSKFKLQSLKQKLWALVAASFIARVFIFFLLPSTPSTLAPDEGTYASLVKWIAESKSANDFPLFGEGLYLSGRSIIIPASFLYRIGFNELDSVRLISSLYGFGALILVVTLILKLCKENMANSLNEKFNDLLIMSLVTVFAFLPSHFVWSNLGLRESATEFWILATFAIFFMLYHFQKRITAQGILALTASIVLAFSSRPQVGWVIGVSLVVYLLFNFKQIKTYFMICIVVCGVVLGSTLNQGGSVLSLSELLSPLANSGELVSSKHKGNQLDAASVIESQSCPREIPSVTSMPPTKFDTYFCIAWRAPYMISTFLFRPIVGVDVTSSSSLIAALENLMWVSAFVILLILFIRKRHISFLKPLLPALIFFALYVLGASAYQGNMGTGFRHKSLILWVLLLLTFALAWRRTEEISTKPRNNSQESAV